MNLNEVALRGVSVRLDRLDPAVLGDIVIKQEPVNLPVSTNTGRSRDYVRKYFNVKNRVFMYCFILNNRCENHAFPVNIMRDFKV